ncbi:MAG TPA: hypothetical protein DDW27_16300 [Bacteroidales bacterium]|nr:hypothetical protein [Bacteroidales bacterium]
MRKKSQKRPVPVFTDSDSKLFFNHGHTDWARKISTYHSVLPRVTLWLKNDTSSPSWLSLSCTLSCEINIEYEIVIKLSSKVMETTGGCQKPAPC